MHPLRLLELREAGPSITAEDYKRLAADAMPLRLNLTAMLVDRALRSPQERILAVRAIGQQWAVEVE